jgi:hypothetical protein
MADRFDELISIVTDLSQASYITSNGTCVFCGLMPGRDEVHTVACILRRAKIIVAKTQSCRTCKHLSLVIDFARGGPPWYHKRVYCVARTTTDVELDGNACVKWMERGEDDE